MFRKRTPAADERHRLAAAPSRPGRAAIIQVFEAQPLAPGPTATRGKRRGQDVFGQPIARKKAGFAEAHRREFPGEGRERRRMNRFGAASRDAPRCQVDAGEVAILDPPHAQVIREARCKADRAAKSGHRPQPFGRSSNEQRRRHQHAGSARIERSERHPDQAHVVVERQPADRDVSIAGRQPRRSVDRIDVRAHVAVRQHDAFRRRRGPRRKLHERDVVERWPFVRFDRRCVERVDRENEGQGGTHRTQRGEVACQRGGRDHGSRVGAAKHRRGQIEVAGHVAHLRRRVNRRRDHAGERGAEQRAQKRFGVRHHHGDEIAPTQPGLAQRARDLPRALLDLGVRTHRFVVAVRAADESVAGARASGVGERLGQRP